MKNKLFREPLKNAKGLGAAKSGTGHFIHQRITAIALVPLVFLFMCFLGNLVTASTYQDAISQFSNPFWVTILIAFIVVGFYHGVMGLQVMIEDYIHHEMFKILLLVGLKIVVGFLTILGVVSILMIAFGG